MGERNIPHLPPGHPSPHPPLPEQGMEPSVPWGGFSSGAPGRARRWCGGDGWDVHVLSPSSTTPRWQALAQGGTIPGGIPMAGRVPSASPAGAAAWGPCPSPAGWRRARQGGGHTGPICSWLRERVRHGSEAVVPPTKIDLKKRQTRPSRRSAGRRFTFLNLNYTFFFFSKRLLEGLWDAVSNIFRVFTRQHGFCLPKKKKKNPRVVFVVVVLYL